MWAVLILLLIAGEGWLGYKGFAVLTEAWHLGLERPKWRAILVLFWVFTTKHLFFRNTLPKLDPYAWIAHAVGLSNNRREDVFD